MMSSRWNGRNELHPSLNHTLDSRPSVTDFPQHSRVTNALFHHSYEAINVSADMTAQIPRIESSYTLAKSHCVAVKAISRRL